MGKLIKEGYFWRSILVPCDQKLKSVFLFSLSPDVTCYFSPKRAYRRDPKFCLSHSVENLCMTSEGLGEVFEADFTF
jgi:hypothetical protein